MKNLHLIPTDKPSRLWINNLLQGKLELSKEFLKGSNTAQNIYITNSEEIKDECWFLEDDIENLIFQRRNSKVYSLPNSAKKIILTTDQDLIADGVQAIDDEFLEWFVKNPSCERVETIQYTDIYGKDINKYKIIIPQEKLCSFCKGTGRIVSCTTISGFKTCDCINIPQEEPKQETIEDAAEKLNKHYETAKWQQEISYSKEEVLKMLNYLIMMPSSKLDKFTNDEEMVTMKWFEQFKKK